MRKDTKIFIAATAIVLVAAGCNQTQPQSSNQPLPKQNRQSTSTGQSAIPKGQTPTRDNPSGQDFFPNGQKPGGQQEEPNYISVQQIVDGSNSEKDVTYRVGEGTNALTLLNMAHKVDAKNFSGIGDFVESIDAIKPDSKHFWSFYINGKSSNVGASSYILKAGDKIEWKLEEIK